MELKYHKSCQVKDNKIYCDCISILLVVFGLPFWAWLTIKTEKPKPTNKKNLHLEKSLLGPYFSNSEANSNSVNIN